MQQHRRQIVSHIDLNLQIVGESNGFHHFLGKQKRARKFIASVCYYFIGAALKAHTHFNDCGKVCKRTNTQRHRHLAASAIQFSIKQTERQKRNEFFFGKTMR